MKKYKNFFIIVLVLAFFSMMRFLFNIEDTLGIQSRNPDMDYYEIHNNLYYYTSYEKGFFIYDKDTKEIIKLSDDKATAASIYFEDKYVFFKTYRGSSIVRMDEDGGNRRVILKEGCYKYRVYDHMIYFINLDDRKLYSCNLDGENLILVVDGTFSGLQIKDEYLYLRGKNDQSDLKLYFDSGLIEKVSDN